MRTFARILIAGIVVFFAGPLAASTEVTLFQQTYTRSPGKPVALSATFAAVQGTAVLTVTHQGVSSALVVVNGSTVFGPSDFNGHPAELEVEIAVDAANTLVVELRGAPGESLIVRIAQLQDLQPTIFYTSYGGAQIRRIAPDGTDELIATAPYGACFAPVVSESGADLAVVCGTNGWDNQVWIMAADGAALHKFADAPWNSHLSWGSDDTEIAFNATIAGIYRAAVAGGPPAMWIAISQFAPFGKNAFRWPGFRWSADHTRFAANIGIASGGGNEAFAGDIDFATGTLSNIRRLSPTSDFSWNRTNQSLTITADGETVFYVWRDLLAGVMELRKVGFDGTGEQTIWTEPATDWSAIANMRFSADGQRLWFAPCAVGGCRIASINPDGSDYQEHPTAVGSSWFDLK